MTTEDTGKNLMSYLRQADATFRNGFESEQLKQIFLRNTFEEISGNEAEFCMRKSFSFILEGMIKEAELEIVAKLFEALKSNWKEIAESPAGCHVLQTIYERMISCIHWSKLKFDNVIMKKIAKFASIFDSEETGKNISSLMKDTHSTQAFRFHLQMLGGMFLPNSKDADKTIVLLQKENIPKGFFKKLRNLCKILCKVEDRTFLELLSDPHSAPCVACLIEVIGRRRMPKTLDLLCNKIMSCCKENTVFVLMKDKHASHVFESLVQYGTPDTRNKMRSILCKDEKVFFDLCVHPTANFVIQKFVSCVQDEENFKEIFDFVTQGIEDILSGKSYGIVQKLSEQCVKFADLQKPFCDKILEAFHCESADDRASVILLLGSLRTHDSFFENGIDTTLKTIEYHGAVLMQTLLKFKNIGLLVKSMCSVSVENIVILACDCRGSHFVDAFFTSDKVKFKIKRDLVKKIDKEWLKIACDKYGSRVLENIWDSSDITIKRVFAELLVKESTALSEDRFGRFIYKKCQLKRYETRLEEWESVQKQLTNKRKMFAGIVPETNAKKTKKRKVEKQSDI